MNSLYSDWIMLVIVTYLRSYSVPLKSALLSFRSEWDVKNTWVLPQICANELNASSRTSVLEKLWETGPFLRHCALLLPKTPESNCIQRPLGMSLRMRSAGGKTVALGHYITSWSPLSRPKQQWLLHDTQTSL